MKYFHCFLSIIDFFWSVVNEEVEKQLGIKEEKVEHTGPISVPVSAKTI